MFKIEENMNRLVYVTDHKNRFSQGQIVDIGCDHMEVEIQNNNNVSRIKVAYEDLLPAESNPTKDVDDCCSLMYLNDATLLNNLKVRYARRQIYTNCANILISINPYEDVPGLYSDEMIQRYKGKSLGVLPPHIFAIANKAHCDMLRLNCSQSIIVSGESGAGKTESQKCILRYLCNCWGLLAGPVEQRLLETNLILEAFGNAKTVRNNNSSRFGKFVEIHFNKKCEMMGGFVSYYLLEKTRVCFQHSNERNFHIFYQLFMQRECSTSLRLSNPDDYNYLKNGCTQYFASLMDSAHMIDDNCKSKQCKVNGVLIDSMVNDFGDFQSLLNSLERIGFSKDNCSDLLKTLSAILHLGNVEFEDQFNGSREGSHVLKNSEEALSIAAQFFGLDVSQLRIGLTTRMMQPTKSGMKGTLIMVPLTCRDSRAARDALAKAVYHRLFDLIVAKVNQSIPFKKDESSQDANTNFIGVLDVAGFESFEKNSFEQFCINYCNEKLQNFFNNRILKDEQELYEKECLNVPRIDYIDNRVCIDLFEEKANGLLDLLDEEARLPIPSAKHFASTALWNHQNKSTIVPTQKSLNRRDRELGPDEGFVVNHYAMPVCYETNSFIEKNNDALHVSLEMLLEESNNNIVKMIVEGRRSAATKVGRKLRFTSVSSKFRSELSSLMEKLSRTGTHFVRCIKPNAEIKNGFFESDSILSQLNCSGMPNVLKLMQTGFPSRTLFVNLYQKYKEELPPRIASLAPRLLCKMLFHALHLNESDYRFGLTKVFFRAGKFAEFDRLMKDDKKDIRMLIAQAESWICRSRWRKLQYSVWACIKLDKKIKYRALNIIKLQSAWRGALARKRCYQITNQLAEKKQKLAEKESNVLTNLEETAKQHFFTNSIKNEKIPIQYVNFSKPKELDILPTTTILEEFDLSSWEYAKIRETIANKTASENLRKACKVEYFRRMKAYKSWKTKNSKANSF